MGRTIIISLLVLFTASASPAPGHTASAVADSNSLSLVWQRETDYWRYVKAGDAESFESLWHKDFIGWPCGQEHPKRKASIGDWVRNIRAKHIQVASTLTREGAEDFGNAVVVHYRITRVDTYPDGKVEGKGKESKITHTWMKVGDSWLIIGGMCGTLPDSAT